MGGRTAEPIPRFEEGAKTLNEIEMVAPTGFEPAFESPHSIAQRRYTLPDVKPAPNAASTMASP